MAALLALLVNGVVAVATGTPASAADLVPVTVRITHVQDIDGQDSDTPADFYAEVDIDGQGTESTGVFDDDNGDIRPDWRFTRTVDRSTTGPVDITIRIKDEDGGFNGGDDTADISPKDQDVDLNIRFNPFSGRWDVAESDVPGGIARGDGDFGVPAPNDGRAALIEFQIYTGADSDFDDDGVPDSVEINGLRHADGTFAADLKAMGANPCQKTILLETDWMQGAADGHNHRPKDAAVTEIQNAFAAAPLGAPAACPYQGYSSAGGVQLLVDRSNAIPEQAVFNLTDLANTRNNAANFDPMRRPYFHYVVFAHDQAAGSGSSGLCCSEKKDLIVTLGSWNLGTTCVSAGTDGVLTTTPAGDDVVSGAAITYGPDGVCNTQAGNGAPAGGDDGQGLPVGVGLPDAQVGTVRQQSGTMMHELGHSLGLGHDGRDDINNAPNYLSVMNYVFQPGIPNAAGGSTLDYSRTALPTLNETSLDETATLDATSTFNTLWFDPTRTLRTARLSGPINWDNTGGLTNPVSVDLNADSGCVSFGKNGKRDTTPQGDDVVANGLIVNGPNHTCETPAQGDDALVFSGYAGAQVNVVCIGGGANEKRDTTAAGDDKAFSDQIQSGPNQICDSTATGDDIQVTPKGTSEPTTYFGWNDWALIKFRAADSVNAGGNDTGHIGDEDYEQQRQLVNDISRVYDPDLTAAKTVDKATAEPGDGLTYTVTAANIGTGTATDVALVDTPPTGAAQNRTLADIPAGGSATETFSYQIACGTANGTVLVNTAAVSGRNLQAQAERYTRNNQATASTTVLAPVMTLSLAATSAVNAGEAITYTLSWANTGGAMAKTVVVTDTVPADVYYSLALDTGAGPRPTSVTLNADGSRTLRWTLGDIAAGATGTIQFTARPTLLALEGFTYTSSASLSFTDRNGCTYPPVTASGLTRITVVKPSGDPLSQGYWAQHPEQWSAELRARIQATDQRYDADGGGSLTATEVTATFGASGNQPIPLRQQLLATYLNLASRRVNAGTRISSRTATQVGTTTVRAAVIYSTDTLVLPPTTTANKTRYSNATTLLDEINTNKSPVF